MKLLLKQKFLSWFDRYDIYDEAGNVVFTVEGQLAWGHKLQIYDQNSRPVGMVQEKVFTFMPKAYFYENDQKIGMISKEFTFFKPVYHLDFNGWDVNGNFMEWDYTVTDAAGNTVAVMSKEIFNWTDTYTIEVNQPQNALYALMITIAIDAEKCSRGS